MPLDKSQRSDQPGWLDGAELGPGDFNRVLHDLATFNRTFLGHYPLLRWIEAALTTVQGESVTLVDIGCGYGDLLRAIGRWSRRRGMDIALIGFDHNPETVRVARAATAPEDEIDFQVTHIFELALTTPVDLMMCSLVTHRLPDREVASFCDLMEKTAHYGRVVFDLQRSRLLYRLHRFRGRLVRVPPPVVQEDRIPVARSLTRAEWRLRLAEAGVDALICWFVFQYLIGRLT